MIELSRICKSYSLPHGKRKDVLRDVSITFRPGVNMGILGLNGQGKSTLIRIISGSERPDSGTVTRRSRVSWPIGFAGGFNGSLTGRENLRFTSRIYGADIQEVTEFVEEFTEPRSIHGHAGENLFIGHALQAGFWTEHVHRLRFLSH